MTYRDDGDAARARRDGLAAALGEVRRRIVQLPVLERVSVATPCRTRWQDMAGDDRVRFCTLCEKNVYDLSAMTAAEAEALIVQHLGDLCARFYRRPDGRVATTDCADAQRGRRRRAVVRAAAAVAVAGAMAVGGAAVGGAFTPDLQPLPAVMADVLAVIRPPEPEPEPEPEVDDGPVYTLGML